MDIGRQARMECIVETSGGDDSSRHVITWMKDGQPLPNRTRIILSGRALQIFVLQREDYGKNACLSIIYILLHIIEMKKKLEQFTHFKFRHVSVFHKCWWKCSWRWEP